MAASNAAAARGDEQIGAARPNADDGKMSAHRTPLPAGHQDQREIRCRPAVVGQVGEPQHALIRHRRPLDVDRLGGAAGGGKGDADFRQVAADLHDDDGIGRGEPVGQHRLVERAGQHAQHVVAMGHRLEGARPAARHAGDAGHHFVRIAARQMVEHVHRRAVEERVALAQQRDIASRVEAPREHARGRLVEGVDGDAILWVVGRQFGGEWIVEAQRLGIGAQMRARDADRVARPAAFGEEGVARARRPGCGRPSSVSSSGSPGPTLTV